MNSASIRDLRSRAVAAQLPNLMSASRIAMAALWIFFSAVSFENRALFGALAIAAAVTDFFDGRVARALGMGEGAGRWLDPVADVIFILAALGCESARGAIPIYIPILIAFAFAQYTIDSIYFHRRGTPIKSRIGHWGGIVNYALVLTIGILGARGGRFVSAGAPAIATFYLAGIVERANSYRSAIRNR